MTKNTDKTKPTKLTHACPIHIFEYGNQKKTGNKLGTHYVLDAHSEQYLRLNRETGNIEKCNEKTDQENCELIRNPDNVPIILSPFLSSYEEKENHKKNQNHKTSVSWSFCHLEKAYPH